MIDYKRSFKVYMWVVVRFAHRIRTWCYSNTIWVINGKEKCHWNTTYGIVKKTRTLYTNNVFFNLFCKLYSYRAVNSNTFDVALVHKY